MNNVDVTIIAQRPKLAPHEPAMKENLVTDLGIPAGAVNVKATTTRSWVSPAGGRHRGGSRGQSDTIKTFGRKIQWITN